MDNQTGFQSARHYNAYIGSISSNIIHLRNPWVVAWWSAALPGFGHLKLGFFMKGFIFMVWEIIINVHARINEAMVFSFNGQFDKAKDVLNTKLLLLYISIYIISIWDSYRQTVDLNKIYLLGESENSEIFPFQMKSFTLNYLDKRNPWMALVTSLLFPGLGQLYLHRLVSGLVLIVWTIIIIYQSDFLNAMHYTLHGSFSKTIHALDPQWSLFLPSIYCFSAYEAYVVCVEYNKLFIKAQKQFLEKNYQSLHEPLL